MTGLRAAAASAASFRTPFIQGLLSANIVKLSLSGFSARAMSANGWLASERTQGCMKVR